MLGSAGAFEGWGPAGLRDLATRMRSRHYCHGDVIVRQVLAGWGGLR